MPTCRMRRRSTTTTRATRSRASVEGISRARMLAVLSRLFARIRRLRKSPRYSLAVIQGKHAFYANLRDSPQVSAILVGHFIGEDAFSTNLRKPPRSFRKQKCSDRCQNPGSRTSRGKWVDCKPADGSSPQGDRSTTNTQDKHELQETAMHKYKRVNQIMIIH